MKNTKRFTWLVITLLFVSVSLVAQLRIVFIGNSITVGIGVTNPATESYPSQVYLLLKQKYGDTCLIFNSGVAGCTMFKKGDYPIWNEQLFKTAYNWAPNICYIMLGSNDTRTNNWEACGGSASFLKDYKAMIDTFRYQNPHILFMVAYPPPAFAFVGNVRNSIIESGVMPMVDSIVKYAGAELVDLHTPFLNSEILFPDKIHPNTAGARVVAQIIYDKMVNSDIIHKAINNDIALNDVRRNRELVVYPNPINNIAHFSIFIKKPTQMIMKVVDMKGRLCLKNYKFATTVGKQTIDLDTSSLQKGTYLFELTILETVYTAKIIKN